ncbi:hypothetical protein CGMCC3_g12971 [Colletotrichum fructicola]|uniref:F-box domain-containing protein n=1 Tax=Colletotrichum fructicola (strain Nara gc5) TaxID=1213859 RepID=L2GBH4_COLFN|nr:uncharacterized protein CGMCC3_g12971 [Colletotrichum fructicola]KAE9571039.1 hypothetical protein CGMCC3_g12971 [Colletotrichum fructicola]KAF4419018.1 hypothetical protein CFRS1_v015694 [Colletotrichum fructicola]KAF4475545.1 hypothetical protein CGGC5_v015983 [Colletotrichum fructicola Nara gc5]KAF4881776.1 hypothetical protein CGCFRS4_v015218 [Colletotrichum fructicola]
MTSAIADGHGTNLKTILNPRHRYPVVESVLHHLNVSDVLSLRTVCRAFDWIPAHLAATFFNLNSHLKGFVLEPNRFRQHMRDCDAIISRGFALNFFVRGCSQVLYLDVFVENGQKAERFEKHVTEEEDYVRSAVQLASSDSDENIQSTVLLRNPRRKTTIRIVRTASFPLITILRTSFTTADLNFIVCDRAYSLFPALTIRQHILYPLRDLDDEGGRRLAEYAHQGWTNRDFNWPDWSSDNLKGLGCRRVGDKLSLVVHLRDSVAAPSSTFSPIIEHSQYKITKITHVPPPVQFGGNVYRDAARHHVLSMNAETVDSYSLRRALTVGVRSWEIFVKERLRRWTRLELFKMEPESRPDDFDIAASSDTFAENHLQPFLQPLSWDYADDILPRWYEEWESTQGDAF